MENWLSKISKLCLSSRWKCVAHSDFLRLHKGTYVIVVYQNRYGEFKLDCVFQGKYDKRIAMHIRRTFKHIENYKTDTTFTEKCNYDDSLYTINGMKYDFVFGQDCLTGGCYV